MASKPISSACLVALTIFSMLESGPELGTRTPKEILFMMNSYLLEFSSHAKYATRSRTKIRNPKHQIRNKLRNKSISNQENLKHRIRKKLVWNFIEFRHLNLFRISDFVL